MRKSISLFVSVALAAGAPLSSWAQAVSGRPVPAPAARIGVAPVAPAGSGSGILGGQLLPAGTVGGLSPALPDARTATLTAAPGPKVEPAMAGPAAAPAPAADAVPLIAEPMPAEAVAAAFAPAADILSAVPAAEVSKMPAGAARELGAGLQDALQGLASDRGRAWVPAPTVEPSPGGPSLGRAMAAPEGTMEPGSTVPPAPPAIAPPPINRTAFAILRLIGGPVLRLFYRVRARGLENLPGDGPALIVANHVSLPDAAFMALAVKRPIRFVMSRAVYEMRGLTWVFRLMGAIPVERGDGREAVEQALGKARGALEAGEIVLIFPEGMLTRTGNLARFKHGFERIASGVSAPVIPAHLDGLWGAPLSRRAGESPWARLRRIPAPVILRFGAPLSEVSVQSAREAVQQLGAASMEERIALQGKTLVREFFATAKARWGGLAAADSTGKELTFGEAATASVLLAGLLRPRIPANRNVGVLLPSSVGGLLANLALGVMGRVPVNLNYTASAEAQAYAVEKAGAASIVTSKVFLRKLEEKLGRRLELPASMICLEDLLPLAPKWKKLLTYLSLRLLPRSAAEALFLRRADRSMRDDAVILFTSGSSGMPKGVELTHMNLRSNIEMVRELYGFGKDDRVLGALPFFHSFGLAVTLWLPMLAGFAAVYHTHPLEYDPIAKLAAKYEPTLLLGTPTFLAGYVKKIPAEAFAKLRLAIAGAEKLREETAQAFRGKFGVRPLEGYGATELSPIAAVNAPDVPGQKGTLSGSVGQPLPGEAVRVVDPETGASLPDGSAGMLLVRGPNVMKGYLGEPGKTAEALQDGWYVTGDIAVVDRDGFVTLVGRLSRFSKIAGEMVSHVAVEEKLHQAAGASDLDFVVMGVPDADRGEKLVVLYAGWEGDIDALLEKARAAGLPRIWTPSRSMFFKIDRIPVLGTGKLDMKAAQDLARKLAGG